MAYFAELGIEPYVFTMGSGTTVDRLFGGLDIPTFNETGKIEYLVENSFMNHEYVIFEEMLDAPDFILEQLKDILSSGLFRNGSQVFPIKTKFIICCTNHDRAEFAKNNSLKALMERFPLECKVAWKDYNRISYEKLLTHMGYEDPFLPYLMEQYAKADIKISPRIAIMAAEAVTAHGPDSILYFAEFNRKPDIIKDAYKKFESLSKVTALAKEINEVQQLIDSIAIGTLEDAAKVELLLKKFNGKVEQLSAIKADDSIADKVANMVKSNKAFYEKTKKNLDLAIATDSLS